MKIKAKLLRYFVLIYGKCTLQLNSYTFKSLSINVTLICLFYYFVYQTNRDHSKRIPNQSEEDETIQKKPLYAFVTNITFYLYPLLYLLHMIYFLFKGPSIVQLLDSSSIRNALKGNISAEKIICIIVAIDICHVVNLVLRQFYRLSYMKLLRLMFIRLTIFENSMIVLRFVTFYKIATYRSLAKIENRLLQKQYLTGKICYSECFLM